MALIWNAARRTYRDTVTGSLLSQAELVALRNAYAVRQGKLATTLANDFLAGVSDVEVWSIAFQELITHMMTTGYVFGRGGIAEMTDADWDALAVAIDQQLTYAEGFRDDLVRGDVSPDQLRARSEMYAGSSVRMAEEGRAAAHDGLELPAFPGDTPCKSRCRCTWVLVDTGDTWEATWALEPGAQHCSGCLENSRQWAPYVVLKETP